MKKLIYFTILNSLAIAVVIVSISLISFVVPLKSYADDCFNINSETVDSNTNTRPFVCFQHDAHNEKAGLENCDRCHHIYDKDEKLIQGESSEEQSCSECHADNYSSTDRGNSVANSGNAKKIDIQLTSKYHKLCRDCHLEKEKGPVVCGECHKK